MMTARTMHSAYSTVMAPRLPPGIDDPLGYVKRKKAADAIHGILALKNLFLVEFSTTARPLLKKGQYPQKFVDWQQSDLKFSLRKATGNDPGWSYKAFPPKCNRDCF